MSPNRQGPETKKKGRSIAAVFKLVVLFALIIGVAGIAYYITGSGSALRTPGTAANGSKDMIDGSRVYSRACTSCHGYAVETLKSTLEMEQMLSDDQQLGDMHSFGSVLSKEQIKAVAEYIIANQGSSPKESLAISGGASTVYANNCAGCHGPRGDQLPNANLAARAFWQGRDVNVVIGSIARGTKGMPAFAKDRGGQLSDDEIIEMVRSLRAFALANNQSTEDQQVAEAGKLYANACATCHGEKGNLLARYDLGSKAFWQSAEGKDLVKSVMEGKGGMPPLGSTKGGALNSSQAEIIIAFLKAKAVESAKTPASSQDPGSATAQPTPAQQSASPSLSSEHDKSWLSNHSRFVAKSGAGRCYKCHDNKTCVDCHVRR